MRLNITRLAAVMRIKMGAELPSCFERRILLDDLHELAGFEHKQLTNAERTIYSGVNKLSIIQKQCHVC